MQGDIIWSILFLAIGLVPICILVIMFYECVSRNAPKTDTIYKWTEGLERSARRLRLAITDDGNTESNDPREAPLKELTQFLESRENKTRPALLEFDPTSEPELPFGRYESPQYRKTDYTPFDLELWIRRMYKRSRALRIEKNGSSLRREVIKEFSHLGLQVVNTEEVEFQNTAVYIVDFMGQSVLDRERVILRIRIECPHSLKYSFVDLTVYSRSEYLIPPLLEHFTQMIWQ
ncbi:MAG: hypothetical protein ACFFEF_07895 [Candidatus Thorarchaeota archaeon]